MSQRFAVGKKAVGFCDVCGFRYKLSQLRKLVVKGKVVNTLACRSCWTPDHPQLMLGKYPVDDPQALRNPRPDNSYWRAGLNGFRANPYHVPRTDAVAFGTATGGSRDIYWGWNPVGLNDAMGLTGLVNTLVVGIDVGSVEVEIV